VGIPGPTGNATAYRADPAGSIAVMSNRQTMAEFCRSGVTFGLIRD
jgi:hypothetical protein